MQSIICDLVPLQKPVFQIVFRLFCCAPPPQQTAVPRNDEWTRFVRTLADINENRDDAEELAAQRLAAWSTRHRGDIYGTSGLLTSALFLMEGKDVTTWPGGEQMMFLIMKKYGRLLISNLPSQLAGPSPVFLGFTKRQDYRPQTLTWCHIHKTQISCPSFFFQTRCLKLTFWLYSLTCFHFGHDVTTWPGENEVMIMSLIF